MRLVYVREQWCMRFAIVALPPTLMQSIFGVARA